MNLSSDKSDLRIQLQTDKRYQDFIGRAASQSVLGYLRGPAAQLLARQGDQRVHVDEHQGGLVEAADVVLPGAEVHSHLAADRRVHMVVINADHWKSTLHERLAQPQDEPGAVTFYHGTKTEHITFAKHLTAEHAVEEFLPGKGLVKKWVRDRRANHHLDNCYNACAAAHLCGFRVSGAE